MAKRRSRGKLVVGGVVAVAVLAGGGVAWASTRSSGPSYRLASVTPGSVTQSVTEVGTISSAAQATLSFPVSGTVASVSAKIGAKITAGHTVATLDTTALQNAVDSAASAVAPAQQRLAADQDAQTATSTTSTATTRSSTTTTTMSSATTATSTPTTATSTATTATSNSTPVTTNSVREVALVAAAPNPNPNPTRNPTPGGGSGGTSVAQAKAAVTKAQHAVVSAQATVDALLKGPVSSGTPHVLSVDLAALKSACASSTATLTTVSSAEGVITGTIAGAGGLPVTLVDATDAAGRQVVPTTVAADGSYSFGSASDPLKATASYTVRLGDDNVGVTASQTCTVALTHVQDDEQAVATAEKALGTTIGQLDTAVGAYFTAVQASGSTGSGTGGGTGSGGTSASAGGASTGTRSTGSGSQNTTGTGSTGSSTGGGATSATITAQQIAADQMSIDAAEAELAVAKQDRDQAVLTTPISGTVAAVAIAAGDSVSAGSSSATVTVIGTGQKKITTTVGIADIDLVKTGDRALVTVDGVSRALSGTVTLIGTMNTSGTSGTTTTYPVTVLLDRTSQALYDGAGATVAIEVGTKANVLTVPSSALHRSLFGTTVDVYANGKPTVTRVTTGVRGVGATEITTGLQAGQRVVLAVVSDPVPSSNTNTSNRVGGNALLGGTAGGAARFAGGGVRAGP